MRATPGPDRNQQRGADGTNFALTDMHAEENHTDPTLGSFALGYQVEIGDTTLQHPPPVKASTLG